MLQRWESITFEANLITFREIKSWPVAFLGILSLKPYFTIETTTQEKKGPVKRLLVRVKASRRVRRVLMMGKARICKGQVLSLPPTRSTYYGTNSVHFRGSLIWNNLPSYIKSSRPVCEFKNNIKNFRDIYCGCLIYRTWIQMVFISDKLF